MTKTEMRRAWQKLRSDLAAKADEAEKVAAALEAERAKFEQQAKTDLAKLDEEIASLFEPLYPGQAKNFREQEGLGLSVTHNHSAAIEAIGHRAVAIRSHLDHSAALAQPPAIDDSEEA